MNRKFAVLIISHGRAGRVDTVKTLKDCGYTGDWYIILDDEDKTIDDYKKTYGEDHIIIFSKDEMESKIDACDHLPNRGVTVYVRNACWDIAKNLGLTHYLELDDDYTGFTFRRQKGDQLRAIPVTQFDTVCDLFNDYLDNTNALTIAFAQGGDFIGGVNSQVWNIKLKRKAMNAFFCRTDRPFPFIGRMNDDVNFYCTYGRRGGLALTVADVCVVQRQTQANAGGMTESYLDTGTYVKSFYSIITTPDCAKIATMGSSHPRIHHRILWENCCPKIINEKFKKVSLQ